MGALKLETQSVIIRDYDRHSYLDHAPVNCVDPSGYSVIDINRKLGAGLSGDTVRLSYNPLTHTYIAINDFKNGGELIEVTHSLVSKRNQEGQSLLKNTLLICVH